MCPINSELWKIRLVRGLSLNKTNFSEPVAETTDCPPKMLALPSMVKRCWEVVMQPEAAYPSLSYIQGAGVWVSHICDLGTVGVKMWMCLLLPSSQFAHKVCMPRVTLEAMCWRWQSFHQLGPRNDCVEQNMPLSPSCWEGNPQWTLWNKLLSCYSTWMLVFTYYGSWHCLN